MSIEVAVLNFLKILNSPDPEISHLLLRGRFGNVLAKANLRETSHAYETLLQVSL
ncbi:hypothetical protein SLEP1_g43385 [Rubroshorea leprosula]|nr:hypothetical protein SLEP1_g43385 [Rubroshorea leprosula]